MRSNVPQQLRIVYQFPRLITAVASQCSLVQRVLASAGSVPSIRHLQILTILIQIYVVGQFGGIIRKAAVG